MRIALLAAGLVLLMCETAHAGGAGENGSRDTTVVRDANGVATITQTGDPGRAVERIEKSPGRTTIYRQSGGNTAIVTMGAGGRAGDIPEWLHKYLGR